MDSYSNLNLHQTQGVMANGKKFQGAKQRVRGQIDTTRLGKELAYKPSGDNESLSGGEVMTMNQLKPWIAKNGSQFMSMFFRKTFFVSFTTVSLSLTSLIAEAAMLRIHRVTWQGSGCDFSSVAATLSPDEREVSLLFDNYRIELESRSNLPQVRKDCLIELDIETSSRIQFAFRSVDYRGFASIPAGMEGFHRLAALLEGERVPTLRENYLRGPIQQNYFQRVQATRLNFSRCGQTWHRVRIYSQLGLNRMRGAVVRDDAVIDLDSKDFAANQGLGLEIKSCF